MNLKLAVLITSCLILVSIGVAAENFSVTFGDSQTKTSGQYAGRSDESHLAADNNHVIVGLAVGMQYNPNRQNVERLGAYIMRPLVIWSKELKKDGSFGPIKEVVLGNKNNVDKVIIVDDGYMVTGWGGSVKSNPNNYAASRFEYLEVEARKLNDDGSFSPVKLFTAGNSTREITRVRLDDGFVATEIGGRVAHGDGNGLNKVTLVGKQLKINHVPRIDNLIFAGEFEGDLFRLVVDASDADNDSLTITFTAPLDSKGEWQSQIGDAGDYTTIVSVADGINTLTEPVSFSVKAREGNHPPVINNVQVLGRRIGDLFRLVVDASDADNDSLTYNYTTPFNASGEWQTTSNDIPGNYSVTVSVADGRAFATRTVIVQVGPFVANNPPIISNVQYSGVREGDLFHIVVSATDADNDSLTYAYSAPFNIDGNWQTVIGDAGNRTVNVSVSDGRVVVTQSLVVTVAPAGSQNLPPVIDKVDVLGRDAGDRFKIVISAHDPENLPLTYTYGSPFDSVGVWETDDNDVGSYNVTITVSDSVNTVSHIVTVVVNERSRGHSGGSSSSSRASSVNEPYPVKSSPVKSKAVAVPVYPSTELGKFVPAVTVEASGWNAGLLTAIILALLLLVLIAVLIVKYVME
ncbi:MAG: hypothetical protein Q7R56_02915 [Nanoarchaeota archaeon]|nr:hypothetical protein [Nanoarchaeota archaeon]